MTYRTPEDRRAAAAIAYHAACIAQYRDAAERIAALALPKSGPKMVERCRDNAVFHEARLADLTTTGD